jgi:hypothetical protein
MADQDWEKLKPESAYTKKCRMTWTALIKAVYEVDPLKCLKCGGTMKVISFILQHQPEVIEKILRHCGLWKKEEQPRDRLLPKKLSQNWTTASLSLRSPMECICASPSLLCG